MTNDWYSDESDETFFRNQENKMSDELNNIHYEILDAEEHLKKLNKKYEKKAQEIRKYNAPPTKILCFYECGNDAEGEWQDHSLCGECFTGFTGHQMQGPMRYDYDYTVSSNNSLRSEEEEKIGRAEERYNKLCLEQDEGGPVYD